MVGFISILRIQRAVSVGNTEESVGLGALACCSDLPQGDTKNDTW